MTLLFGRQEGHPACKKEWRGAGVVTCLERDADLHMAQLMPLPRTVSCYGKIQTVFTFLVPAHPGSSGKRAVKRVCVCVLLEHRSQFNLPHGVKKTNGTRCKAKPDLSPPGYPPSHLCPVISMHYFRLRPATHMQTLLSYAIAIWRVSPKLRNSI